MEMVSASRLRRAQERALAARPYAEKTRELLQHLASAEGGQAAHPLLASRPLQRVAVVLIASDRGLCGGYNQNVIRLGLEYGRRQTAPVAYVTVGRKAREAVSAARGDLMAEFEGIPRDLTIAFAAPMARLIEDAFLGGDIDGAVVAYTRFVTVTSQAATIQQLLPIRPAVPAVEETQGNGRYTAEHIYEPSAAAILRTLLPHSLEVEMLGCLFEAAASEHAARMVAMRSATDNAAEVVEELTRTYNRARQQAITSEIIDIAAATEALRGTAER